MPVNAASNAPRMTWWKVLKARDHGGAIYGQRRKVGEVFEAPESAMQFDVLEGLVEKTADPSAGPVVKGPPIVGQNQNPAA